MLVPRGAVLSPQAHLRRVPKLGACLPGCERQHQPATIDLTVAHNRGAARTSVLRRRGLLMPLPGFLACTP